MNAGLSFRGATDSLIELIPTIRTTNPKRISPIVEWLFENDLSTNPTIAIIPVIVVVDKSDAHCPTPSISESAIIHPVILVPSNEPSIIPID